MSEQDTTAPLDTAASPGASAAGGAVPAERAVRSAYRRAGLWLLGVAAVIAVALGSLIAGVVYFDLERHPIVGNFVRDRLVALLQDKIDPGLRLSIERVDLRRQDGETIVDISDFRVRDISSRSLFHAPSGRVRLSRESLFQLRPVPVGITLDGLKADIEISETGAVVVSETPVSKPGEAALVVPSAVEGQPLQRLKRGMTDMFVALGALRQAIGGRLPDVGIDNASLALVDHRLNKTVKLERLMGRLKTAEDGSVAARLEFRGRDKPVALDVALTAPSGATQTLSARTEGAIAHFLAHFGIVPDGIEPTTPVAVKIESKVGADMQASAAKIDVEIGKTKLDIDRKMAPIPFEEARLRLNWNDGAQVLAISEMTAVSENTRVKLTGEVAPPAKEGEGWKIRLRDAGSLVEPLAPGDKPIAFDLLSAELTAFSEQKVLVIDKVDVRVGAGSAHVAGRVYLDADNRAGLNLTVGVEDADARVGMRLWPGFAATEVRNWLARHVRGGHAQKFALNLDFPPEVLEDAVSDRPIPESSVLATWTVSQGTLQPLPGAPIIQGLSGSGRATGRTVTMDIASGHIDMEQGRRIVLSEGVFSVPDVSRKPAEARIRAKVSGPVEAALEFCRNAAILPHVPKGLGKVQAKGQIDGALTLALRISPRMAPGDTQASIVAALKGLSVDKSVSGHALEAGTFQLSADRDVFSMKGEARLMGTPAQIEVKGSGKSTPVASIQMVLDDAARARQGMAIPAVTGPVALKLSTKLDENDDDLTLDADLARLAITEIAPGVSKKAGVPGRLKGVLSESDAGGWSLNKMELDFGAVSARGAVQIAPNGQSMKAQVSSLKLSSGDAMQVDVERSGAGTLKLQVRGNSVDARPFLRSVLNGSIDKSGGKDLELHLKSTVLSGFNGELITNADVRMQSRGGALQRFDLTGRFDGGPIVARLLGGARGQSRLTIASDDGGAFLRFFDIYNRMRGGRLDLAANMSARGHAGNLSITSFILRDEPALKRLVAEQGATGSTDDAGRISAMTGRRGRDGQDVPFQRMTVGFTRTPGRLDLRDGLLIGPEVGGNVQGRLDYARDVADLTGTFIPAYSLNNAIANVPLVGPLLAGGRNEGLFAVRYNITGKVSAPTLSINPLTAIAPGFLRKLIDFRGNGGAQAAPRPVN